jgi:AraC-like DNA-binding protein
MIFRLFTALTPDIEDPGKTDLIGPIEKHDMFNMPLEKFGYLASRSLSTFHCDFKMKFNTSPQKWLTKKRLELAHYHIIERQQKPSEVHLEVGFEDLSQFSFAFKEQYGYSQIRSQTTHKFIKLKQT